MAQLYCDALTAKNCILLLECNNNNIEFTSSHLKWSYLAPSSGLNAVLILLFKPSTFIFYFLCENMKIFGIFKDNK